MKIIDLRSDTVTLPTEAMRKAMAEAELGDDVFGEDPSVNRLQEVAAERMGMEAALFVPSGTMANLVCALTHCGRGEEAIVGNQAHMFIYEAGGMAAVGGIHPHAIANQSDGTLAIDDIRNAVRTDNVHFPRSRLICLENTHNRCEGAVLGPDYLQSVVALAREKSLRIHLDGARIFNASIALGCQVRNLTHGMDSVSFCLSKGLSAPVGSLVCGSKDFVREARRRRKLLGGGMRQAGVLAAAGIVALQQMVDRLAEDHENARRLAAGIQSMSAFRLANPPQTNMVYAEWLDGNVSADQFLAETNHRGLRFLVTGHRRFRMVTHYGINASDIDRALAILADVSRQLGRISH
ncbi:MAG: low-specificity L-threonine aldolase [Phycisphaerae bacterium]|nr:low-specificity L-threonine aldolase [Phycisphaerae bacterium]